MNKKINKILHEEIKGKILELLMKNDLSFSQLLNHLNICDHGQLNYHLKSMIKQGIIENRSKRYFRTSLGERMGVYINQFQSKEMYPITVVCAIIKNDNEEILLLKRAKDPQKGKWGFPGGKIALGEKISRAAEREVLEETGIIAKFEKVIGFFPTQVYKNKELSFHANIIPVLMKIKPQYKINLDLNENTKYEFFKSDKLKKIDIIKNNRVILEMSKTKGFNFKELIFKE